MGTFLKILKSILPFAVAALLVWGVLISLGNLSGGSSRQEKEYLEDALRRAAVSCYACEGFYPPNVDYMVSRYGIQIDEARFKVFYEVYAKNMMPVIDVVMRNE